MNHSYDNSDVSSSESSSGFVFRSLGSEDSGASFGREVVSPPVLPSTEIAVQISPESWEEYFNEKYDDSFVYGCEKLLLKIKKNYVVDSNGLLSIPFYQKNKIISILNSQKYLLSKDFLTNAPSLSTVFNLIEAGLNPFLLEQGECLFKRIKDIRHEWLEGLMNFKPTLQLQRCFDFNRKHSSFNRAFSLYRAGDVEVNSPVLNLLQGHIWLVGGASQDNFQKIINSIFELVTDIAKKINDYPRVDDVSNVGNVVFKNFSINMIFSEELSLDLLGNFIPKRLLEIQEGMEFLNCFFGDSDPSGMLTCFLSLLSIEKHFLSQDLDVIQAVIDIAQRESLPSFPSLVSVAPDAQFKKKMISFLIKNSSGSHENNGLASYGDQYKNDLFLSAFVKMSRSGDIAAEISGFRLNNILGAPVEDFSSNIIQSNREFLTSYFRQECPVVFWAGFFCERQESVFLRSAIHLLDCWGRPEILRHGLYLWPILECDFLLSPDNFFLIAARAAIDYFIILKKEIRSLVAQLLGEQHLTAKEKKYIKECGECVNKACMEIDVSYYQGLPKLLAPVFDFEKNSRSQYRDSFSLMHHQLSFVLEFYDSFRVQDVVTQHLLSSKIKGLLVNIQPQPARVAGDYRVHRL